jgi:hypothetical protein
VQRERRVGRGDLLKREGLCEREQEGGERRGFWKIVYKKIGRKSFS